jgi:hypothetical protein
LDSKDFIIQVASPIHTSYAEEICHEMEESAKARGTGIAKRSPEYVADKMREGKAIIALHKDGTWAGFCYIETWGHAQYVANSGLIVSPKFRKYGLATSIKHKAFELSRTKYPNAKLFGLTTGLAVMKINSELGYEPVTYSELTQDEEFWSGCKSCVNFDILTAKERKNCLCTAMLYDPADKQKQEEEKRKAIEDAEKKNSLWQNFLKIKNSIFPPSEKQESEEVKEEKGKLHSFFSFA